MTGTTPTLPQGTLLNSGRYCIDTVLGEGGFGVVYLARHLDLDALVAIKATTDTSDAARQAFLDEARLLSRLRHPHLPRVTDYFIEGQQPCLVMDYIPGKDLEQILHERGAPLAEAEVRAWAAQVLEALVYLHSQNPPVVHRDIKPGNIRLAENGGIYLVDFGIAKLGDETTRTQRAARAISPPFSPPEQYGGAERTDVRSDIYAFGATLYVLLTRTLPPDVPFRQIGVPFPVLPPDGPPLSPQIQPIIARAMQLNPADRYLTAQALATALSFPTPSVAPPPVISKPVTVPAPFRGGGPPCPRCGEVPTTANTTYCPACGALILLKLPTTGRLLASPTEFLVACDTAWGDAAKQVQSGELARWLEVHQQDDLLKQLQAAQTRYPTDAEAALELLLRPNPAQDLTVVPSGVDFGVCEPGAQAVASFTLGRKSPGLLYGTVTAEAPWLVPSSVTFRLEPSQPSLQLIVRVDLAQLLPTEGQRDYRSALTLSTNRGDARIPMIIVASNPPRPRLAPTELNLGKVESFRRTSGQVAISNGQGGTLTGTVAPVQPWLTIEAAYTHFTLGARQAVTVPFDVLTEQLPRGLHRGQLRWETNAGSLTTNLQLEVTPPYMLNPAAPATALKQHTDLVKLCDCLQGQGRDTWLQGLEWLQSGQIGAALRFFGERDLAQRIEQLAQAGDPNRALEQLLRACGAKPARNYKDNGGEVIKQLTGMFSRKPTSVTYTILNTSKRGYLHGIIRPMVNWISLAPPYFGCLPGEVVAIEITPDYQQRTFGNLFETLLE